jgi:hypothetical protein
LYKDGEEFLRNESRPLITNKAAGDPDGIPILQKLTLGSDMPPGHYVLQLLATDKKGRENVGSAGKREGFFSRILRAYLNDDPREEKGVVYQTLSFTVAE